VCMCEKKLRSFFSKNIFESMTFREEEEARDPIRKM
jgi:hypothetical protein